MNYAIRFSLQPFIPLTCCDVVMQRFDNSETMMPHTNIQLSYSATLNATHIEGHSLTHGPHES